MSGSVKSKILAEASVPGYHICYRRVKSVNELIINGYVYDEKRGIIEFSHKLCARLDGHTFAAGLDDGSDKILSSYIYSYILFDGDMVVQKERIV